MPLEHFFGDVDDVDIQNVLCLFDFTEIWRIREILFSLIARILC